MRMGLRLGNPAFYEAGGQGSFPFRDWQNREIALSNERGRCEPKRSSFAKCAQGRDPIWLLKK